MLKQLNSYIDLRFFLRFAAIFFLLYCTYTFVNAVSVPSGTYYPFIAEYLNFPILIRIGVLQAAHLILNVIGYQTQVNGAQIISNDGLNILEMAWACYGMGLKSFWVAFVCAHAIQLKTKFKWSLIGVFTIFSLNCIRVVVIMLSLIEKWTIADYLGTNAHDLFNYLCYAALLGLVLLFYARVKVNQAAHHKLHLTTNSLPQTPLRPPTVKI